MSNYENDDKPSNAPPAPAWLLASIIESSEDAIITKDLHGIITSWNDTAKAMFEYSANEVIGRSIKILIPEDRYGEEIDILKKIGSGERIRHYETERLTKSGKTVNISLTISPIKTSKNEIVGASKIARDISKEIRMQKKIRLYVHELEMLNKMKDDAINLISHELKTPLTSTKAYIQLLHKLIDENHQAYGFISRAEFSLARLESLINDQLDVSKIRINQLEYNKSVFPLNELILESVKEIQQYCIHHKIVVNIESDIHVRGDRGRLKQVLNNLLSNAIKFSPKASTVDITSQTKGDSIEVAVADYGIGISDEYANQLKERYYRIESETDKFIGLGLGLFIVNDILDKHDSELLIESTLGVGSRFSFFLPVI